MVFVEVSKDVAEKDLMPWLLLIYAYGSKSQRHNILIYLKIERKRELEILKERKTVNRNI